MAIFNKDGKAYILEGPNPLVKKQVNWDRSKLVFHNFNWDETITRGQRPTEWSRTSTTVAEPPPVTKKPQPIQEPHVEEYKEVQPEESKPDFELPHIKHKVLSYCLPAKVDRKTDKFYGESWMKVTYGKKMVFPSVMTEATDFSIEFWTSDPNEQISEKSIIYPFAYEVYNSNTESYDRVPYDEYRWWKVSEKKKIDEGGWLFRAVPSDNQPDFSD
jgi:hypothetical protein